MEKEIQESISKKSKIKGREMHSYTEEDLQRAVQDVREHNSSVYSVAKKFKNPIRTLAYRVKGKSSSQHGHSSVLPAEVEKELAEWILRCANVGDPRTKQELLIAASELALLSPDESRHFKNDLPSLHWLKGFMKRHPQLSFRTPSTVSKASANVSRSDILNFFRTFIKFLCVKFLNLMSVFENLLQVANGDESGFELNPIRSKVLAASGSQHVYRQAIANPKEQVSVMFNFLASGHLLPPQLILKNEEDCNGTITFRRLRISSTSRVFIFATASLLFTLH